MRIIFCDSNIEQLNQLQNYVREYFNALIVTRPEFAAYTRVDKLLANESFADIAFLDLEVAGRNGIYAEAQLKKLNPRIKIFIIAAYPDYLDEAMRLQSFCYLSNPIDKNRLFYNLKEAVYQYGTDTIKIPVSTSTGITMLSADHIVCVELLQRKTIIYTLDGQFNSTESMEFWRNVLRLPCFYSTYRSFIINMQYVYEIQRSSVVLKYGSQIKETYLAKRKYSEFTDAYMRYLELKKSLGD